MDLKIDDLNIQELESLILRAKNMIDEKRETDIRMLRTEIESLILAKGFTFEEVFPKKSSSKAKRNQMFFDPNDPNRSWTGRGRRPKWLLDLIQNGFSLDELRA